MYKGELIVCVTNVSGTIQYANQYLYWCCFTKVLIHTT